ncbi:MULTISPECIES: zinc-ribbon domain-containing protein [Methanobacterium]|uniref:zinc-ribbon domain-containing protein n=1 Tax=Methanobacterium TaxID=2160 RepID=UPI00064E7D1D
MILCSECGKENEDSNKFCSGCGAILDTFKQVIFENKNKIKQFKLVSIIMITFLSFCLIISFIF